MTEPNDSPPTNRDAANWAGPVDRLSAAGVAGAKDDAVTGKRVSGPLQGFGQLWQKTFTVRLDGTDISPTDLIALWKDRFPTFWPKGQRFYAPLSGIAPGEVALLEIAPVPGAPVRLSTGVLVVYADDESFTFMTPEGHTLSAWITFSARRDGDVTIAQAQALERPADPFDELAYMLGGNRINNRFWEATLGNLAMAVGVAGPVVETQVVCIDRKRQWRYWRNVRNSASIRSARRTLTAPFRKLTGRGRGPGSRERPERRPPDRRDRGRGRPERPGRGDHPGSGRALRTRLRSRPNCWWRDADRGTDPPRIPPRPLLDDLAADDRLAVLPECRSGGPRGRAPPARCTVRAPP